MTAKPVNNVLVGILDPCAGRLLCNEMQVTSRTVQPEVGGPVLLAMRDPRAGCLLCNEVQVTSRTVQPEVGGPVLLAIRGPRAGCLLCNGVHFAAMKVVYLFFAIFWKPKRRQ